ncbi:MAG: helix-turn-helix domain-containing protein, partial [Erysipelotrichaceae bacterium]|nr:helix-turn-helix domain-containing protein [Erysipelotrichaceae bacterium]
MGRKVKYTKEQIIQACEDYLNGRKRASQIAAELNMSKYGSEIILKWVKKYGSKGEEALEDRRGKHKTRQEMELELLKKDEAFEKTYLASLPKAKRIYLMRKQKIKDYSLIQ